MGELKRSVSSVLLRTPVFVPCPLLMSGGGTLEIPRGGAGGAVRLQYCRLKPSLTISGPGGRRQWMCSFGAIARHLLIRLRRRATPCYSLLPHDTQCRSDDKSDVRSKRVMATWENKAWSTGRPVGTWREGAPTKPQADMVWCYVPDSITGRIRWGLVRLYDEKHRRAKVLCCERVVSRRTGDAREQAGQGTPGEGGSHARR